MRAPLVLWMAIVVSVACGSSSTTSPTGTSSSATSGTTTSTFTATIDGVAFVGKTVTATYHEGTDFSTLLINAVDGPGNLLSFYIGTALRTAFTATTYPLGSNGSNATYNPSGTVGNTGWNALNGPQTCSVIVTAFSKTSKTASGTFAFVLHNSSSAKTVTNGVFNVTFP